MNGNPVETITITIVQNFEISSNMWKKFSADFVPAHLQIFCQATATADSSEKRNKLNTLNAHCLTKYTEFIMGAYAYAVGPCARENVKLGARVQCTCTCSNNNGCVSLVAIIVVVVVVVNEKPREC